MANFQISLSAWGVQFLKTTPWMHWWMLMVFSLVTTSMMAKQPFFFSPPFWGTILPGPSWKGFSVRLEVPISSLPVGLIPPCAKGAPGGLHPLGCMAASQVLFGTVIWCWRHTVCEGDSWFQSVDHRFIVRRIYMTYTFSIKWFNLSRLWEYLLALYWGSLGGISGVCGSKSWRLDFQSVPLWGVPAEVGSRENLDSEE